MAVNQIRIPNFVLLLTNEQQNYEKNHTRTYDVMPGRFGIGTATTKTLQ